MHDISIAFWTLQTRSSFNCGNKEKGTFTLECFQIVLPCQFLVEIAGKDENCFVKEKLILVVKSTLPKIIKRAGEQNRTACVQNRLVINKFGHSMEWLVS